MSCQCLAWEQQGHHSAMVLSQLWVLNHLAPVGDLSVIQRHPQWDTVVSLNPLKCPVLLGCLHTTRRTVLASCMHAGKRTVWFELRDSKYTSSTKSPKKEHTLKRKLQEHMQKLLLSCAEKHFTKCFCLKIFLQSQ